MRPPIALIFALPLFISFGFAKEEKRAPIISNVTSQIPSREVYSHFLRASLLQKNGELERSLKEYDKTLELEPEATWVLSQRATLHLKMGNPEKGLADALKYAQLNPKDPKAHLLVANIYLSLNQKRMAQNSLEKGLEEDPNHADSLLLLGQILLEDDPLKAVEALTRLVNIHPGSAEGYYSLGFCYQRMGKPKEAKSNFEKVIELDRNSFQSLMLLGQMSETEGKTDDALFYYEKALQRSPFNEALRMQLVKLYRQKKEYQKMIGLLEEFETGALDDLELHAWLAMAYEQTKQPKKAIAHYESAAIHSANPEIYLRLATLYSQEGDTKNVIRTLKDLNKKFPNEPQFLYLLGLAALDQNKPKEAIPIFKKVHQLNPKNVLAAFQLGVAYDSLKKWDESEKYLREAIQIDSSNASSYNYLGYSYADKNENLEESRKLLTKALELDPKNAAYLDSFGWLLYREKNYTEALGYFEKSAKALADATVFLHMGDCYSALGNLGQASLSYDKALDLDPANKETQRKVHQLNRWLVPTSPARKLLRAAQKQWQGTPYLSGHLRVKIQGSALGPSYPQTGAFYLKKEEQVVLGSTVPTFLRVDFIDPKTLFPITLWYKNSPKIEWNSFPLEIKESFPPQTKEILDWIASLFNGRFLNELDHWETEVTSRGNSTWLHYKNIGAKISKEGTLEEIQMDGWKLQIKKLEKLGKSQFPTLIKMSGNQKIEIEFFQLSPEKIEENLFQMGKNNETLGPSKD